MAALSSRPGVVEASLVREPAAIMHAPRAGADVTLQGKGQSAAVVPQRRHRGAPLAFGLLALGAADVHAALDRPYAAHVVSLRTEARAYEHGEGVPRNAARAVELYCKAARIGDAEAQFSLGWMYANGRGVARDDAMAALFFGLAAAQGHEHASRMLRFVGDAVGQTPECLRDKPPAAHAQVKRAPAQSVATGPRAAPNEWTPAAAKPLIAAPEAIAARSEPEPAHEEPDVVDSAMAATPAQKQVAELVNKLAPEYGVSPRLAFAVIRFESNFDPLARSEKNAQGLMQLIPETAARFNVTKPFDPVQNVRGGLAYLRWLLAYFRGNVPLVIAAYNAGEGTVNRHRGIPPFAETRAYVGRVMSLFGRDEHPYDPAVTAPSPELPRIRRR